MITLATQKLFFAHAWQVYLIGGFLLFLLGLFIGRNLWGHCRSYANRVEAMNDELRERKEILTHKNRQLTELVDKLPKPPAA